MFLRIIDDVRMLVAISWTYIAMKETFSALDVNTRLKMQDLLMEIWAKLQTTIIFVTHDISEAVYLADEIHIMRAHPGKIVERIPVVLPGARTRQIKRSSEFMRLTHDIEDTMIEIEIAMGRN